MLKKTGFVEPKNNFSQKTAYEILAFFHDYDFRDKEGRELIACRDFIELVNQAKGTSVKTPAEEVLQENFSGHCLAWLRLQS
ncbi:hypothetical protein KKJ09_21055 [Xenorhabdus bovienii]|uniref:hypothetical protein n=1 Tax=Xenorhabdus bovienii TaxID=40576 RepID=UPI0023B2D05E|nr:hypothetical protein [Xenorhabdus bovienii]MDE9474182.1 hypothetical protein [Xenorhabdus bovienii]MDE9495986.1 hypothetical protein [Xenorhabdus bovienii]MDE9504402.1 hypothetical protein [Xenorhabdus bovienii]MDE9528100.1 hypothetical protein [Xenorhabdus bovienii]MDE9571298.1 hypothetical protein [Xenorhabdus bovienii]